MIYRNFSMLSELSMKTFDRFSPFLGTIFFSNFFLGVVDSGKHGESMKRIKSATCFPLTQTLSGTKANQKLITYNYMIRVSAREFLGRDIPGIPVKFMIPFPGKKILIIPGIPGQRIK